MREISFSQSLWHHSHSRNVIHSQCSFQKAFVIRQTHLCKRHCKRFCGE